VNAGVSVKNIGGMTFKDANNASNNYALNILHQLMGWDLI
jgi:hypothetical protein